ncbi:MAG: porin [Formosimonas sp.]
MKLKLKWLCGLGVCCVVSPVVWAANSVELYGIIGLGVAKKGEGKVTMAAKDYSSRLGIKGQQDLGHGLSAIFKLEAELLPDEGTGGYGMDQKTFGFNRDSWVGLQHSTYGSLRLGRSISPLTSAWGPAALAPGRGVASYTSGILGVGLRNTQPEAALRWNNSVFYDFKRQGLALGMALTTSGSQSVIPTGVYKGTPNDLPIDNEGAAGTKPAYGAYIRYQAKSRLHGYKLSAAYQVDNGGTYAASSNTYNAPAEGKRAWLLGGEYSYGPLALSMGYSRVQIDNTRLPVTSASLRTGRSQNWFAALTYKPTSVDKLFLSYGRYKRHNQSVFQRYAATGTSDIEASQLSLGYEHSLSPRTVVFANVRQVSVIRNACAMRNRNTGAAISEGSAVYGAVCGASRERIDAVFRAEKGLGWDFGIAHSF